MATFGGLAPNLGFNSGATPFLAVPEGGTNLLMLFHGKELSVNGADPRVQLREIHANPKDLSRAISEFVLTFYSGANVVDLISELWTRAFHYLSFGGRMFSVKAKGKGLSHIIASHGRQRMKVDVAILPYDSFTVSFRFLQHATDTGGISRATTWTPEDAEKMLDQANLVFRPQVNIEFDLVDAEWITVSPTLPQPIGEQAFRNYIAKYKSGKADVTVFFVGKWASRGHDPNGSYLRDEKVIAVDDKPDQPEADGDPFVLTLSHELAHYVQHTRGLSGHHDRDKVLLSNGIQSLKIDKQLVADLNPW